MRWTDQGVASAPFGARRSHAAMSARRNLEAKRCRPERMPGGGDRSGSGDGAPEGPAARGCACGRRSLGRAAMPGSSGSGQGGQQPCAKRAGWGWVAGCVGLGKRGPGKRSGPGIEDRGAVGRRSPKRTRKRMRSVRAGEPGVVRSDRSDASDRFPVLLCCRKRKGNCGDNNRDHASHASLTSPVPGQGPDPLSNQRLLWKPIKGAPLSVLWRREGRTGKASQRMREALRAGGVNRRRVALLRRRASRSTVRPAGASRVAGSRCSGRLTP